MSGALVAGWLRLAAARIAVERARLTELDAAIGDGDHGINLDRGFRLLAARLAAGDVETASPGALLVLAGRTITGTVGGASGALYGRALMRAGATLEARLEARPAASAITPAQLAGVFWAAIDGVAMLGRSRPGEKTMLDALVPAAVAFEAAGLGGVDLPSATRRAADAAEAGALRTLPLVARKGRASYLGRRSVDHLDPGAVSSALLVRALADAVAGVA